MRKCEEINVRKNEKQCKEKTGFQVQFHLNSIQMEAMALFDVKSILMDNWS